ncbi:hypothetical protein BASA61_005404 [Batrachochytrium salamandrivorans]|nr:hypothetical protein BASA62_007648 [Batrachochytrium salamandrivorans]KAH6590111.1 hypothetical protein BASA61_005404 [Batrachochytrium salamandrivorans]
MSIQALPDETAKRLSSAQVAVSPDSVLKELIENAIDAGSSSIQIRVKEAGLSLISVKDDGCGIPAADVPLALQRYTTSKISCFDDLAHVQTFGFRALHSMVSLSTRTIIHTRTATDDIGRCYEFDRNRRMTNESTRAMQIGTQIDVERLFHHIPVRKQIFSKTQVHICKRMRDIITGFALLFPRVRITAKFESPASAGDDASKCITKTSVSSTIEAVRAMFGNPLTKCLARYECELPISPLHGEWDSHAEEEHAKQSSTIIEAILPRHESVASSVVWRAQADQCFIYINYRRSAVSSDATIKELCGKIRKILSQGADVSKYPFMWVHIKVPVEFTDVNIEPDKTNIGFRFPEIVLAGIDSILDEAYPPGKRLAIVPQPALPVNISLSGVSKANNSARPILATPSELVDLDAHSSLSLGDQDNSISKISLEPFNSHLKVPSSARRDMGSSGLGRGLTHEGTQPSMISTHCRVNEDRISGHLQDDAYDAFMAQPSISSGADTDLLSRKQTHKPKERLSSGNGSKDEKMYAGPHTHEKRELSALERLIALTSTHPPESSLQDITTNNVSGVLRSSKRRASGGQPDLPGAEIESIPLGKAKMTARKRPTGNAAIVGSNSTCIDSFLSKCATSRTTSRHAAGGIKDFLVRTHCTNSKLAHLSDRYASISAARRSSVKSTTQPSVVTDTGACGQSDLAVSGVGLVTLPHTDLPQSPCVVIHHCNRLWIVNIPRLEETILYNVLIETFSIPSEPLETPIALARHLLHNDTIIPWMRGLPTDPATETVIDRRITANGFTIQWDKEKTAPMVTGISAVVKLLDIHDLCEILTALHDADAKAVPERTAIPPHLTAPLSHLQVGLPPTRSHLGLTLSRPRKIALFFRDRARLLAAKRIMKLQDTKTLVSGSVVACTRFLRLYSQQHQIIDKLDSSSIDGGGPCPSAFTFSASMQCPHHHAIFSCMGDIPTHHTVP